MRTAKKQTRFPLSLIAICVGIALTVSTPSFGGKVYKWIDEDGKITYRDKPPPVDSSGKTEVKDIDTDSNIIKYDAPPEPPKSEPKETAPAGDKSTAEPTSNSGDILKKGAATIEERRRLEELRKAEQQRRQEEEQRRIEQMPKRPLGF